MRACCHWWRQHFLWQFITRQQQQDNNSVQLNSLNVSISRWSIVKCITNVFVSKLNQMYIECIVCIRMSLMNVSICLSCNYSKLVSIPNIHHWFPYQTYTKHTACTVYLYSTYTISNVLLSSYVIVIIIILYWTSVIRTTLQIHTLVVTIFRSTDGSPN